MLIALLKKTFVFCLDWPWHILKGRKSWTCLCFEEPLDLRGLIWVNVGWSREYFTQALIKRTPNPSSLLLSYINYSVGLLGPPWICNRRDTLQQNGLTKSPNTFIVNQKESSSVRIDISTKTSIIIKSNISIDVDVHLINLTLGLL